MLYKERKQNKTAITKKKTIRKEKKKRSEEKKVLPVIKLGTFDAPGHIVTD